MFMTANYRIAGTLIDSISSITSFGVLKKVVRLCDEIYDCGMTDFFNHLYYIYKDTIDNLDTLCYFIREDIVEYLSDFLDDGFSTDDYDVDSDDFKVNVF